ncbi:MAG TPA: DNA polymerase IV [Steroidobacter sp.]|jgi:DNA polymerase-4|nr:DNA polymerase IV [Steroidobacter sp.]
MNRAILHVDMDAFYASVEARDHPELRGKPLIVGGLGGRGVVAAASYEVRKFGVHSAMPMREALRRCPHAVCVRPRFERYKAASAVVFDVFRQFTPLVEGLSLDEAFLDVTRSQAAFGSAEAIGLQIKKLIAERTGLTASVGVAPNKLVAKIASDLRKPDGFVVAPPDEITALLDPLPIRRLFGVGAKTAERLERIGVQTFRDLRLGSDAQLRPVFGVHTARVKARAAGIDDRPVVADWDEKQISAEETFDVDIADRAKLHAALADLTDRMTVRLRRQGWLTQRVIVKIRRQDFTTYTRQRPIRPATQDTKTLASAAAALLDAWSREQPRAAVRLLGVGASDLTSAPQLEMFSAPETDRNGRLDAALDDIRAKFGSAAVARASALRGREPR